MGVVLDKLIDRVRVDVAVLEEVDFLEGFSCEARITQFTLLAMDKPPNFAVVMQQLKEPLELRLAQPDDGVFALRVDPANIEVVAQSALSNGCTARR